jgi:hypothetical protein
MQASQAVHRTCRSLVLKLRNAALRKEDPALELTTPAADAGPLHTAPLPTCPQSALLDWFALAVGR